MKKMVLINIILLVFIVKMFSINNSENIKYMTTGIIGFDNQIIKKNDAIKIANKWKSDNNFNSIIVRLISENNYGIQFVYISNEKSLNIIKSLEKNIRTNYGEKSIIRIDYDYDIEIGNLKDFDQIIIQKAIK